MESDLRQGLYVPELESDACGTGLIANLNGDKTHELIDNVLLMLRNMEHRGACGCEPNSGDGAGILLQKPDEFLRAVCPEITFPDYDAYGLGMIFFPKEENKKEASRAIIKQSFLDLGFEILGYRKVPVNRNGIGVTALSAEPDIEQVFVVPTRKLRPIDLERKLLVARKFTTHLVYNAHPDLKDIFYFCSLSYKTCIYKGQLTTFQLQAYYEDLQHPLLKSAIALIHSRFSTNTVPKWKLAQPFRYIAHNGEINTIAGNLNWWKSKERDLVSSVFTKEELEKLKPVYFPGLSDSGNFDNVLEFLVLNGKSVPEVLMMMIPEAWEKDPNMVDHKKAFYEFHSYLMEPWDGPASICFTDGILVGATLDRNGLRPSRYLLTDDNVLIVASEAGVLEIDQSKVVKKGRLQSGKILIADLDEKRIIGDSELKDLICQRLPYRDWLDENRITLKQFDKISTSTSLKLNSVTLKQKQHIFGYTEDDLKHILLPMLEHKKDPIGSMGVDTPLAILSQFPQHISNYFKQLFAQVTNPPIDPIREKDVMSLSSALGSSENILERKASQCSFIHLNQPILRNTSVRKLKSIEHKDFRSGIIKILFKANGEAGELEKTLLHISDQAVEQANAGVNILILSDREVSKAIAPIPSLLALGAIHHRLIKEGLRNRLSIVMEVGDAWHTHQFATLIGYGADAINPYLTIAAIKRFAGHQPFLDVDATTLKQNYVKAVGKGLLKIISKIGISTIQSYKGSQIFEILGLDKEVVDLCFKGSVSRIAGMNFDALAKEVLNRHFTAYANIEANPKNLMLDKRGLFQWKKNGEGHLFNPTTIHLLQHATRSGNYKIYKKYAKIINEQTKNAFTLRGLLEFKKSKSMPIEEVESINEIMKRFATGAMSFGSLSHEAHSTLAIAMNRIGGKSNSGEGGEDDARYEKEANGDWERSAIKQVASGRFGVTSHYLTNADEIQIKMAQGAKPGEGGQLPGHKVNDWIARVRHSIPGVGLISPPPHHDIYSIEDLAQLIFDLKNANRKARINVKLVSKAGVGIIASGVTKAKADVILISGHDGGTGASPISSIRHTGLPWELGLAEAQQTLLKNGLRDRVVLQTDGQIKTGRDVAIATLLGAEEWGVATAVLVVEGCIMMRKCHLNTCPVGVATQDPELRKRFNGNAEYVINFFKFLAEELREIMAELGFRTINEMVGRVDCLQQNKSPEFWKYQNIDLSPLLYEETATNNSKRYNVQKQDHNIDEVLDWKVLDFFNQAINDKRSRFAEFAIKNTDRAVGAIVSNEISRKYGKQGMPEDFLDIRFVGSAGQSFGAFAAKGLKFTLEGEANDYLGKGLSGAKLIVSSHRDSTFDPSKNIIVGNVALYGATSGEVYIKGMAGERFAVRNSGAKAVVEGIGDHGCEYMTGGLVLVLGKTGKNFAAGMSGGMAFIYNQAKTFKKFCNMEMVDIDPLMEEDFIVIRQLLRNHFLYTGSRQAVDILNNWESMREYFVKVMPKEYKRVLADQKKQAS